MFRHTTHTYLLSIYIIVFNVRCLCSSFVEFLWVRWRNTYLYIIMLFTTQQNIT